MSTEHHLNCNRHFLHYLSLGTHSPYPQYIYFHTFTFPNLSLLLFLRCSPCWPKLQLTLPSSGSESQYRWETFTDLILPAAFIPVLTSLKVTFLF